MKVTLTDMQLPHELATQPHHYMYTVYHKVLCAIPHFCSSVWEAYKIHKFESVQTFVARIATKNLSESPSVLKEQLHWPSLSSRKSFQKFCLCRRFLSGGSLIPDSTFLPHPHPDLLHPNSRTLYCPQVCTNYHLASYFVSTVPLWNNLPQWHTRGGGGGGGQRVLEHPPEGQVINYS